MIMAVEELRKFIITDKSDDVLEVILQALESMLCKYTNNNFINRETKEKYYPADVKMGVINLIKWEIEQRDKVGIQSESLSRHSVTYFNMTGDNSISGYPSHLMSFLKPYMKARF